MTEKVVIGKPAPGTDAERAAAWAVDPASTPEPDPLTGEEMFDILKAKGLVEDSDRPRPKPTLG